MNVTQSVKKQSELAFEYIKERVFNPETKLLYDHCHARELSHFPTTCEVEAVFPNPDGYSVGMEDGMINGGTMADACLIAYELTGEKRYGDFARDIITGMLDCAECAKSEGFIPRGVSAVDRKSCYPDSSIDQYTMFVFGMIRFLESGLATDCEKKRIEKALCAVARRAEKNPTPENGYDLLRDDGGKTLAGRIWGKARGNHETMRLPMIFAAAYKVSGDKKWLAKYHAIRDEGFSRSLPMNEYWHLYTLQQMQASVYVCKKCDDDPAWQEKYDYLTEVVADYAEGRADSVFSQIRSHSNYNAAYLPFRECGKDYIAKPRFTEVGFPDAFHPERPDAHEFFTLQDAANVVVVACFDQKRTPCKKTVELFEESFMKIDLSRHERCVPIHFINAYFRLLRKDLKI